MRTPTTSCRRWLMLLIFASLSVPGPAPALADGGVTAAADEAREVTVAIAIGQLRREFSDALRKDAWPRTTASFAQEHHWTLSQGDLLGALIRRLDRNPTMEAYLKWQLLSFEPDLDSLTLEEWERLLVMAPEPLTVPSPRPRASRGGDFEISFFSGRQIGYVRSLQAVVGDGVAVYRPRVGVISGSGVIEFGPRPDFSAEGVVRLNRDLANARRQIRRANQPIYAYRNALLMRAPAEEGIRFAALVREIRTRLEARDPSAVGVLEYLLEVGPGLVGELDDAGRAAMRRAIENLADWEAPYTRAFDVDLQGELVANTEPLRLPREGLDLLAVLLTDRREFERRLAARRDAEEPNAAEGGAVAELPGAEDDPAEAVAEQDGENEP